MVLYGFGDAGGNAQFRRNEQGGLTLPNQERPSKPVPESYVPPAGSRHPVAAGETWISLANRIGIDPWDLIEFNFPGVKLVKQRNFQQATRQVNWYLAEYVGCRAMSRDRQNFAFSSGTTGGKGGWRGGFVYLPPGTPPPPPVAPTPLAAPHPPRCEGNRPDFARVLDMSEQALARNVFGPTLPSWDSIAITNGLGLGGRPWTNDGPFFTGSNSMVPRMRYAINLGNVVFSDLTSPNPTFGLMCADFGRICDLFVHEMTHVWQAFNDSNWTMARSAWAQSRIGAGYEYTPGDSLGLIQRRATGTHRRRLAQIQGQVSDARRRSLSVRPARDSLRTPRFSSRAGSGDTEKGPSRFARQAPGLESACNGEFKHTPGLGLRLLIVRRRFANRNLHGTFG
jgi:hypothetical protein